MILFTIFPFYLVLMVIHLTVINRIGLLSALANQDGIRGWKYRWFWWPSPGTHLQICINHDHENHEAIPVFVEYAVPGTAIRQGQAVAGTFLRGKPNLGSYTAWIPNPLSLAPDEAPHFNKVDLLESMRLLSNTTGVNLFTKSRIWANFEGPNLEEPFFLRDLVTEFSSLHQNLVAKHPEVANKAANVEIRGLRRLEELKGTSKFLKASWILTTTSLIAVPAIAFIILLW